MKYHKGYEIDKENSTFECIKFKPIRSIKTTEDLIETDGRITGYWINDDAEISESYSLCYREYNKNVFLSEKEAKSALAMAQISQLMPYYGGAITDREWSYGNTTKYAITRYNGVSAFNDTVSWYHFLAFHTKEQRDDFFEHNYELVHQYLMLD